ncbi:MAG TPA: DUF2264 domain-containing protein [Candidatus Didemnitutus sp.]|nr:DUF2264 domain-containing protein [Candidatus Didemnitutus sp.]
MNVFADNPLRTRADLQKLAIDLTTPLVPHFSPSRARVVLGENRAGYGDPACWLEGFARPLWGLVPLAAGGGQFAHWELWQQGFANGSDPKHTEYWGLAGDFDQRSVEQAAFGVALAMAPKQVWEPLSATAKAQLADWLRNINRVKVVNNNWLFFRVLVNAGLERCGENFSQEQVDADLTQLDRFYVGDGWYIDGPAGPPYRDGHLGDYYVPMAFHFYSLLYTRLAAAGDPPRIARYVERARRFAQDFQYYFAADGSALPFGRSLTYRFAQGAFWGGLAYAGVEALPWGVIKGLYLRHLRWWLKQPIFSDTGVLTIGYGYPNLIMAESYNSPGSPYWAMKALLPLALPDTHPFWRAEEAPLPPRRSIHTIAGAKLIIATDAKTHDITAVNPGQAVLEWPRNAPQKYSKCAYSTRFAFTVPVSGAASAEEGGLDGVISLSDDGRTFHVREQCFDPEVREGVAFSHWERWPGVELATWTLAEPTGHLRVHRLRTNKKLWAIDAGFAVPYTDRLTKQMLANAEPGPTVRTPHGASLVRSLSGERSPECVDVGANGHLLASLSAMPLLRSTHEAGEHWLACWVAGSADPAETFADAADFSVEISGGVARVLRRGATWWSSAGGPCGESSAERRAAQANQV